MNVGSYAARRNARIARIPADTIPGPTLTGFSNATVLQEGGTTVTLTGSGFMTYGVGRIQSVYLGGTLMTSVSVVSDTSATAVTPAHAIGAVTCAINTEGGCATLPDATVFV